MSNQVFDIVQAMSGQGNCITIPGPYLDLFAGDRQQHLLAAILNQLVFWSGTCMPQVWRCSGISLERLPVWILLRSSEMPV
ncbi:hypothetical protein ACHUHW_001920 [Klebsiella michiganensis]